LPGAYPVSFVGFRPDSKVIIAGSFYEVNGVSRRAIACLNRNGSLDNSFQTAFLPGVEEWISAGAIQRDGKIVVAGTSAHLPGHLTGFVRRLNIDGSVDLFFYTGLSFGDEGGGGPVIRNVTLQSSGEVLVCGQFSSVNSVPRNALARLSPGGNLDLD